MATPSSWTKLPRFITACVANNGVAVPVAKAEADTERGVSYGDQVRRHGDHPTGNACL